MYIYMWGWNSSHTIITSQFCVLSIRVTPELHYCGCRWSSFYSMDLFANWISESFMSRFGFVWGREQGWGGEVLSWLLIPKTSMGISSTLLPVLATLPQAQGAAAGESQDGSWEWDTGALCGLRLTQREERQPAQRRWGVSMLGEIKLIRAFDSSKRCGNGCNRGLQSPNHQGASEGKINSVAISKETPGYTLLGGRVLSRPKRLNYFNRNWTKSWGEAHEGYYTSLCRTGEQGIE